MRRKARLLILDTLGCAIAGYREPKVAALRASQPVAAFAMAACWHEACEGLARAHGRPGVPVIAACLGMNADVSLGAFIDAVIAGYEVGGRMGEQLRIKPGMHVDASWPALGAAAGAVHLMKGSAKEARAAIELAACQVPFSLYLPVEQGADGRNTYLGHAAWLGLYAAQAALAGIAAPSGAVGRFAELALDRSIDLHDDGTYLLREGYLKAFAAVRHVHYGAEAALRLRPRLTSRIEAIELTIYPEAVTYCGNRAPRTPIQAQFSLSYGIAAALRFGRLDADQYAPSALSDPELRRLEALVGITTDDGKSGRVATLRIDGLEERVTSVKGDPASPMGEDECRAKFLRNGGSAALADALLAGPDSQPMNSIVPRG
ncbi:MAG TPA: MmgE/PrpD family protein [Burkholderiales bacterium]|nr:MmgE/PrpD family protein [Burkholderiales bacterium]